MRSALYLLPGILFLLLVNVRCTSDKNRKTVLQVQGMKISLPDTSATKGMDGQALAMAYCQGCHLYPEPALLDKQTWKRGALPNMAMRLGLSVFENNPYDGMSQQEMMHVLQANAFSGLPLVSQEDWDKIVEYYVSEAPETPLPQAPKPTPLSGLPGFSPETIHLAHGELPLVTMLTYDKRSAALYVGDRRQNVFIFPDNARQPSDSIRLESPPADLHVRPDGSVDILTMGHMDPSDEQTGQLLNISRNPDSAQALITGLPRPVHVSVADLNGNGKEDYVVCGFGNHTGKLSWYENQGNGQWQERVLKNVPGARKTIIHDFNGDGRPDIMALMTQGNEGIWIFYNLGKNRFRERNVLRFPPVYGSAYVELADFNGDGKPDILYTNGDNADFSITLKNYHGIRIFLNDGRDNFTESWFYPMHGASKAIARDFDGDGDLDIAAIAFFADFDKNPEEGFVYLENTGGFRFQPHISEAAGDGRWLVMETADLDGDGDEEIILGSFLLSSIPVPQPIRTRWATARPDILILRNESAGHQAKSTR